MPRDKRALAHLVADSGTETVAEAVRIDNLEKEGKVF